ncbi:cohesin domain-containing protein [Haloarchaeobius sp. HRN-SO-5]|uniref:cohesin domain-containing protein n=1 Tax=Haloarchaeobius sp. HRN-SO-5 TaxID=3446118 RepID=UPI003EBC6BBD
MTSNSLPDGTTVLLAAICAASLLAPVATADATTPEDVTLALSSAEADATGDAVTVTLAATGENVAGYQANVTFDPDVVQVRSVEGADFSRPVANVNNDAGWVFVTQSRASGADDPALARITVEVVGSDGQRSALSFVESDTRVNDGDGDHVGVALDAGAIGVGDGGLQAHDGDAGERDDSADDDSEVDADDGVGVSTPVMVGGAAALLVSGAMLGRRGA